MDKKTLQSNLTGVRTLVRSGDLKTSLNELNATWQAVKDYFHAPQDWQDYRNRIDQLTSRYETFRKEVSKGILDYEQQQTTTNRLSNDLITLITDLETLVEQTPNPAPIPPAPLIPDNTGNPFMERKMVLTEGAFIGRSASSSRRLPVKKR